ncbi:MAG: hypothetical protein LUE27_11000 [Clostridia bacterium]|nr:hypothetical protein [Clostridia bacterium]
MSEKEKGYYRPDYLARESVTERTVVMRFKFKDGDGDGITWRLRLTRRSSELIMSSLHWDSFGAPNGFELERQDIYRHLPNGNQEDIESERDQLLSLLCCICQSDYKTLRLESVERQEYVGIPYSSNKVIPNGEGGDIVLYPNDERIKELNGEVAKLNREIARLKKEDSKGKAQIPQIHHEEEEE